MIILVINTDSSALKYQLLEMGHETVLAEEKGLTIAEISGVLNGENDCQAREDICRGLEGIGIEIDLDANRSLAGSHGPVQKKPTGFKSGSSLPTKNCKLPARQLRCSLDN